MKYIATYENFNYQPTNEEFIGLLSAKTRNEKIKQGFENASKLIEGDKSLQDKIMAAYNNQSEKPSVDEMKDAIDIVSGSDDSQIQSLEKELKADPVTSGESQNESTVEPKTFIQKSLSILGKIWKFGVNLIHFMGALAMIILPFTAKLGATVISSGEASGNTSLTWYGFLLMFGGIAAMMAFIYRRVSASEDKRNA